MIKVKLDIHRSDDSSPLDMIQDLAEAKGWHFERRDPDMLAIKLPGKSHTYEAWMEWQDEFCAVLLSCTLPVEIRDEHYETAARTIQQVNENLWLGHFDLSTKGSVPTFRHTLLLRMMPANVSFEITQDLLELAAAECDRFISTFQLLSQGDARVEENLTAAVFETVGEA